MTSDLHFVHPPSFAKARGYANGAVTQGPLLHVGGQIGWTASQDFEAMELVPQFAQALDNVLAVVEAAGARGEDIASMTVYVTDIPAYRAGIKELGAIWRERLGKHYPAMALVGVNELVEPRAKVEIQATAVLGRKDS